MMRWWWDDDEADKLGELSHSFLPIWSMILVLYDVYHSKWVSVGIPEYHVQVRHQCLGMLGYGKQKKGQKIFFSHREMWVFPFLTSFTKILPKFHNLCKVVEGWLKPQNTTKSAYNNLYIFFSLPPKYFKHLRCCFLNWKKIINQGENSSSTILKNQTWDKDW